MEIPKPVGCISRDLTMQEVLHYFYNHQSYPVSKCPATRLKEESYFSILYYQAIKVCKPVLIYCVCTFVVVSCKYYCVCKCKCCV